MASERIFLFIFLFAFIGCNNIPKSKGKIDYFNLDNYSNRKIELFDLKIHDTILIDGKNISLEGEFFMKNDSIYFFDRIIGSVFVYDLSGENKYNKLSVGRGPNEVLSIEAMCVLPGGEFVSIDYQWNVSIFDENWKNIKTFHLVWNESKTLNELMDIIDPEDLSIYEFEYGNKKMVAMDEVNVFIPITTEHVHFNGYEGKNTNAFYNESLTMGILSLQEQKVVKILCNYSPIYSKYHYLSTIKYSIFDSNGEDKFYFSFEADSLIYLMRYDDMNIISFGCEGINMNTKTKQYKTFDESEDNFHDDRMNLAYYRDLKYIKDTDVLFRTYRKGVNYRKDGLQIYKDNNLTGDVEVPFDFKIFGYNAPYYYASVSPDYEEEVISVYRFTIE